MKHLATLAVLAGAALAAPAFAQLEYVTDFDHRFAWQENTGWVNFADYGPGGMKVFAPGYMNGWVWGENIGWIRLSGQIEPANGNKYANVNSGDYGVNVANNGSLSGYGWGENVGWINFSGGALASPPDPAMLDKANLRLRGYAWGENIGWLNLDDAEHYVGVVPISDCYADCDENEVLDLFDFLCFQNAFVAEEDYADCDGNNVHDLFDFLCYQNAFVAGCP